MNFKITVLSVLFIFSFCLNVNAQKARKIFNYLQENQLSLAVEEYNKISSDKEYDNDDKVLFAYAKCLFQIDTSYQKYNPIQSIKDFNNISVSSYTKESIDKFLVKYSLSNEIISDRINRQIHLQAKKINTVESYKNALNVCSSNYKDEFEKLIEYKIKIELHYIKSLIDLHQLMNKYQNYIFQSNTIDSFYICNKSFSYDTLIILTKQKVQEKYKDSTLLTISNILFEDAIESNEYELLKKFNLEFKTDNRVSEINEKLKLFKFAEISNSQLNKLKEKYYIPIGFNDGIAPFIINNKIGYFDTTGKIIIPCIYEFPKGKVDFKNHISKEGFVRVQKEEKFAFFNIRGKQITEFKYDWLFEFKNGLAVAQINDSLKKYPEDYCCKWKIVIIDTSGKEVVPEKYNSISDFKENLATISINGKYGVINNKGELIISLKYDGMGEFKEGIAIVRINEKYGIINHYGKEVVSVKYNSISDFKENLATISINGKFGVINNKGELIIPLKYDGIGEFKEGIAIVSLNHKYGIINNQGKEIVKPYEFDFIREFKDGFFEVGTVGTGNEFELVGIMNTSGHLIIPLGIYSWIEYKSSSFQTGFFIVYRNGKKGVLNSNGEEIIPLTYEQIYIKKCLILGNKNNKWALFDKFGKEINSYLCDEISWLDGENIIVKTKDKSAIINDSGKIISNYYNSISPLTNGFYRATNCIYKNLNDYKENCNVRILNKKGKEIDSFDSSQENIVDILCSEFFNGVSWLYNGDKMKLINSNGEILSNIEINGVNDFKNGLLTVFSIKTNTGYKEGLINNKGEIIIPAKFYRIFYGNDSHAIVLDENYEYKILQILNQ